MGKLLDSLRAEQTTTQTDTRRHKRDFLLHKADAGRLGGQAYLEADDE